jgi:hypothetical protein
VGPSSQQKASWSLCSGKPQGLTRGLSLKEMSYLKLLSAVIVGCCLISGLGVSFRWLLSQVTTN